MSRASLKADCSKCAALCCIALPFDKSDKFAFDKPGGAACKHLLAGHACSIHNRLVQQGFSGCTAYECHGAGQRVVQDVFGGRSWQDDASLVEPMSDAFFAMRQIHDLLYLLSAARQLPLEPAHKARCAALEARLDPQEGWNRESLASFQIDAARADVSIFLRSLQGLVERTGGTSAQKKTPA